MVTYPPGPPAHRDPGEYGPKVAQQPEPVIPPTAERPQELAGAKRTPVQTHRCLQLTVDMSTDIRKEFASICCLLTKTFLSEVPLQLTEEVAWALTSTSLLCGPGKSLDLSELYIQLACEGGNDSGGRDSSWL